MNELALFAGIGGGILGGGLLGWRTVCAVEREPYAASVLAARQNDGVFPPFPIWDDVCSFRGKEWRGLVDVVSAGFPCQDLSSARTNSKDNGKQLGLDGPKSGLWKEAKRIICEVEPSGVLLENSPNLITRGLGIVLSDLASLGFNARWAVLSGETFGAPHERERVWVVATHPDRAQRKGRELPRREDQEHAYIRGCTWWKDKPTVPGVDDGIPARSYRLKAGGNAQIPIMAATAWRLLSQ